jgi:hypothetical protein
MPEPGVPTFGHRLLVGRQAHLPSCNVDVEHVEAVRSLLHSCEQTATGFTDLQLTASNVDVVV